MALKKCKECGNEVSTKAKACPKCGAVVKPSQAAAAGCLILLVIVVVLIWGLGKSVKEKDREIVNSSAPASSQSATSSGSAVDPGHPDAHLFSDDEKKYFGAAAGYLKTANEEDTRLAVVMAGGLTGESTLGDIKEAIKSARSVEDAVYLGFYQFASPPERFVEIHEIHKKIQRCRKLHNSAFDEFLEYWSDSNLAHLESGNATFKRAVIVTNECIDDLTRTIKEKDREITNGSAPADTLKRKRQGTTESK